MTESAPPVAAPSPSSSPAPTTRVPVWDLPVRLVHWSLVPLFAVLWISGSNGRLDIHFAAGTLMLILLVFRLAWGVVGSPTARFANFVRGPGAVLAYLGRGRASGVWSGLGHNPLGGWSVTVLLGLLLLQSLTGLFTSDDIFTEGPLAWTVSAATVKQMSSLHRLGEWVLLGLVCLHVTAILAYRFVKREDLISPMIGGDADLEPAAAAQATARPFASLQRALGLLIVAALLVQGGLSIWGR